jgi:hypothetical protein
LRPPNASSMPGWKQIFIKHSPKFWKSVCKLCDETWHFLNFPVILLCCWWFYFLTMTLLCLYRDAHQSKKNSNYYWKCARSGDGMKLKFWKVEIKTPVTNKKSRGRKKISIREKCLKEFPHLKCLRLCCCVFTGMGPTSYGCQHYQQTD